MKPSILSEPVFNIWYVLLCMAAKLANEISTESWQGVVSFILFCLGVVLALLAGNEFRLNSSDDSLPPMSAEEYNYYKNL